jgi:hypothetical protein
MSIHKPNQQLVRNPHLSKHAYSRPTRICCESSQLGGQAPPPLPRHLQLRVDLPVVLLQRTTCTPPHSHPPRVHLLPLGCLNAGERVPPHLAHRDHRRRSHSLLSSPTSYSSRASPRRRCSSALEIRHSTRVHSLECVRSFLWSSPPPPLRLSTVPTALHHCTLSNHVSCRFSFAVVV